MQTSILTPKKIYQLLQKYWMHGVDYFKGNHHFCPTFQPKLLAYSKRMLPHISICEYVYTQFIATSRL
jgi:hypothetical protein